MVMRVRWLRRLLYIAVPIIVLLWVGFWTTIVHTWRHYYECNDDYSRHFLDQLVSCIMLPGDVYKD